MIHCVLHQKKHYLKIRAEGTGILPRIGGICGNRNRVNISFLPISDDLKWKELGCKEKKFVALCKQKFKKYRSSVT